MKLLMENWRKFVNEQSEQPPAQEEAFSFAMNGDYEAPKRVPLTWGGSVSLEDAKKSALNSAAELYGSPEKAMQAYQAVLKIVGGEPALAQNLAALAQRMVKGPAYDLENVPPRGDMPVLDPAQFEKFVQRIGAGHLDTKEDFADSSPLAEGALDSPEFPDDMHAKSDQQKAYFLQKGTKDQGGAADEDRDVQFAQDTPIPVGKGYPTQQQIYADKALFNLLNFGATRGGQVHGSQVIAVKAGEDFYILDGHHRWASAILGSPTNTMLAAIIAGFPGLKGALGFLRAYGGAIGNAPRA